MGWFANKAAEALGEIAGRQTVEALPAVMHPRNSEEAREASHQQVAYQKSLAHILKTEEMQDAFDDGFIRGIAKARKS